MRLSPLLKDDRYRDAILAEAALIIAEQEKLQATGADKIEGSKVCERLAAAVTPAKQAPSPKAKPSLTAASGKEIGQVLADTKAKGITININPRSEEQTSELQSLMRISYAVFCLKKHNPYSTLVLTRKYYGNHNNKISHRTS